MTSITPSRRRMLLSLAAVGVCSACRDATVGFGFEKAEAQAGTPAADGHLLSRPPKVAPPLPLSATGALRITFDPGRDGVMYVPRDVTGPVPLLVLLHGATGSAAGITARLNAYALAEELKMVILAPDSRGRTWDAVGGHFGPDVAYIDRALRSVFLYVPIDPKRIAIGGFSDGASYAISLGLQNGDLFTHVAAFSPGFYVASQRRGRSRFYVSHGRRDEILPYHATSAKIVPALEADGYTVRFKAFDGPHTVPADIAREAFEWIAGKAR